MTRWLGQNMESEPLNGPVTKPGLKTLLIPQWLSPFPPLLPHRHLNNRCYYYYHYHHHFTICWTLTTMISSNNPHGQIHDLSWAAKETSPRFCLLYCLCLLAIPSNHKGLGWLFISSFLFHGLTWRDDVPCQLIH